MLRVPSEFSDCVSLPRFAVALGAAMLAFLAVPAVPAAEAASPAPSPATTTTETTPPAPKKRPNRKAQKPGATTPVAAPAKTTPPPASAVAAAPANPAAIYERGATLKPATEIDRLVLARLTAASLEPAPLCTDAVFVRRAYLDVIGTLPTATEARRFLQDRNPDKRTALIDTLLARDEFADYWTMKWCDLLRVKAEFPINLWPNAAQAYRRWVYTAVRDNLPYDQFARTLLTASGSNFRDGPVNFYRAAQARDPQGLTRVAALTFMGSHAEKWPAAQAAGLAPCFSAIGYKATQEWKEEIVFFDRTKLATPATITFPDGTTATLNGDRDPREVFADWLIRPDNPWFARALVNRAWSWLLGRGIVHEPDDLRPDNPPANPELLAYLEKQFVAGGYDLRKLFRLILTSQTYQLSSVAHSDRPEAAALFASYPLRRLDAEVLIDALNQITGTTEKYSSAIPEPFTFIPENQRSIALPDGSITSSFLEMFGRPSRDTGEEAERNNRITANQRLHLLNSTHVQKKIEDGPKLQSLLRTGSLEEKLPDIYFTILSRPPTDAEKAAIAAYAAGVNSRTATIDVLWALINSTEFLYRH
ncbi:DUF1553 domain-containing protein [Opitutus sp. ER46]|uniref:DUF1553 domain-containing protein n=1 Tax=Opitutus sp. ER46 TaxID=2161864 RepID=UPI000D323D62|nr:DUF1553 domain-containing protein [Opitutus sp. ER46]PTX97972.1 hypothetical protein DB354_05220 [Opitutus sp. ER46]